MGTLSQGPHFVVQQGSSISRTGFWRTESLLLVKYDSPLFN